MIKFKGINHIAMVTPDMDKTIRFWRDLLGMKLLGGHGEEHYRQYFFEITPGCMISFYEWPGAEIIDDKDAGRPVKGKIAFDHLAFEVDDQDRLWEIKDALDASLDWVSMVIDNGFIHSIFTFDPNNISIEICCRRTEIDLKHDLKMADTHPSSAALEGTEPRKGIWPDKYPITPVHERNIYEGGLKKIVTGTDQWEK